MKENTKFSLIVICICAISLLLVWALLEYLPTFFTGNHALNNQTFESKVKAAPQDIIHSKAYKNEKGQNNIQYAYLGEPVVPAEGEDVTRRTLNSQTYVLERRKDSEGRVVEKLRTTFLAKSQFYKDKSGWRHIEYATTTEAAFNNSGAIPYIKKRELVEHFLQTVFGIKPVFASVSTFYPNPDIETTSVDGYLDSSDSGQSVNTTAWSNARSGTGLGGIIAQDATTVDQVGATDRFVSRTSTYNASVQRAFLLFDTSSLTTAATISSATLSIYVTTIFDNSSDSIGIVTTTPASNTAIVTGDWGNVGSTLQASSVTYASLTASAYNSMSLNSTGLGNISKTSITKFGLRSVNDINNTLPSDVGTNIVSYSSADNTGTSQDPKLDVTYTTGTFSVGNWFPF